MAARCMIGAKFEFLAITKGDRFTQEALMRDGEGGGPWGPWAVLINRKHTDFQDRSKGELSATSLF